MGLYKIKPVGGGVTELKDNPPLAEIDKFLTRKIGLKRIPGPYGDGLVWESASSSKEVNNQVLCSNGRFRFRIVLRQADSEECTGGCICTRGLTAATSQVLYAIHEKARRGIFKTYSTRFWDFVTFLNGGDPPPEIEEGCEYPTSELEAEKTENGVLFQGQKIGFIPASSNDYYSQGTNVIFDSGGNVVVDSGDLRIYTGSDTNIFTANPKTPLEKLDSQIKEVCQKGRDALHE